MKCPSCQFVCSDLRDLCPHCYLDLRAHKKELGVQVTHPGLTYDEILLKYHRVRKKDSTSESSLFSWFGKKKSETTASPESPVVSEPSHSAPEVSEIGEIPLTDTPRHSPAEQFQPFSSDPFDLLVDTGNDPIRNPPPSVEEPIEAAPNLPEQDSPHDLRQNDDIQSLFDFAAGEIVSRSAQLDRLEVSFENIVQAKKSDDIEILFELCADAILDPESEKKYQQEVVSRPVPSLKSEELQLRLKQAEQQVNAPVFSLKGSKSGKLKKPRQADGSFDSQAVYKPAQWRERFFAFLLDCAVVFGIAVMLTGLVQPLSETITAVKHGRPLELYEVVPFLTVLWVNYWLLFMVYFVVCFGMFGQSYGLFRLRLRVLDHHNHKPTFFRAGLRTSGFFLSTIFLGFIPIVLGRQALHDRLSRTFIVAIQQ